MNYIEEDSAFERWCENNYLPIFAQAIWKKLFKRFNRSGWREWVTVDNLTLMAEVQIRREKSFIDYRDKLVEAGLIEYVKGKKGSPNKYKLIPFEKYTFTSEVHSEVQSAVQTAVESEVHSEVQSAVQTADIKKDINNTKPNETKKSKTNTRGASAAKPNAEAEIAALIETYTENDGLRVAFTEYVQHRMALKPPMTALAMAKLLNQLDKWRYTDAQKIECLNQSIRNGWKGVFELKLQPAAKNSGNPFFEYAREQGNNDESMVATFD